MIPRTVRGAGMALALAGTEDAGRSDAAQLARGARHRPVRASRLAPPQRVVVDLTDDEEPAVPTLDVLTDAATNARGRVAMLRAAAALYLHAASLAVDAADALEMDGTAADTGDVVAAGVAATAATRKAGSL